MALSINRANGLHAISIGCELHRIHQFLWEGGGGGAVLFFSPLPQPNIKIN